MKTTRNQTVLTTALATLACAGTTAHADDAAELAKKLQNPIAALISVPMQYNWDTGIGYR